jgi:hypothetical protein
MGILSCLYFYRPPKLTQNCVASTSNLWNWMNCKLVGPHLSETLSGVTIRLAYSWYFAYIVYFIIGRALYMYYIQLVFVHPNPWIQLWLIIFHEHSLYNLYGPNYFIYCTYVQSAVVVRLHGMLLYICLFMLLFLRGCFLYLSVALCALPSMTSLHRVYL